MGSLYPTSSTSPHYSELPAHYLHQHRDMSYAEASRASTPSYKLKKLTLVPEGISDFTTKDLDIQYPSCYNESCEEIYKDDNLVGSESNSETKWVCPTNSDTQKGPLRFNYFADCCNSFSLGLQDSEQQLPQACEKNWKGNYKWYDNAPSFVQSARSVQSPRS